MLQSQHTAYAASYSQLTLDNKRCFFDSVPHLTGSFSLVVYWNGYIRTYIHTFSSFLYCHVNKR